MEAPRERPESDVDKVRDALRAHTPKAADEAPDVEELPDDPDDDGLQA